MIKHLKNLALGVAFIVLMPIWSPLFMFVWLPSKIGAGIMKEIDEWRRSQ